MACRVCNHNGYTPTADGERLEKSLGMGSLIIHCDVKGKNFKLGVKGDERSNFVIYKCPTCGRFLE